MFSKKSKYEELYASSNRTKSSRGYVLSLIILAVVGLSIYLIMFQRSTDNAQYIVFERPMTTSITATITTQPTITSQATTPNKTSAPEMLDVVLEQHKPNNDHP